MAGSDEVSIRPEDDVTVPEQGQDGLAGRRRCAAHGAGRQVAGVPHGVGRALAFGHDDSRGGDWRPQVTSLDPFG